MLKGSDENFIFANIFLIFHATENILGQTDFCFYGENAFYYLVAFWIILIILAFKMLLEY